MNGVQMREEALRIAQQALTDIEIDQVIESLDADVTDSDAETIFILLKNLRVSW